MENRAVKRATQILSFVGGTSTGLRLTDIATGVRLSNGTTYRILQTLVSAEFIRFDRATTTYFLGSAAFRLGQSANLHQELRQVARPHLETLRSTTKETVALVLPHGDKRLTIEVLLGLHELKAAPEVGSVKPIYAGAAGKALIAFYTEDEVGQIIERTRLKPVTGSTIRSPERLKKELARIHSLGYAESKEEAVEGQAAVAVPIFCDGKVAAALNLCGPTARFTRKAVSKMVVQAVATANKITRAITAQTERASKKSTNRSRWNVQSWKVVAAEELGS